MSKHKSPDQSPDQPFDPAGREPDPAGRRPVPEQLGARGPVRQTVDPAERPDATQMPDELARAQAEHAQGDPKAAPLIKREHGPEDTDPGPPDPPVADAGGPVPRLIHQNERAPQGLKRFKIRCINYAAQPQHYVLAKDQGQAREEYVKAAGLQAVLDTLGKEADPPRLSVRELPD